MRFLSVVLLAVLAAVAYGVVHDQVTVRASLEYFTIGHPPVFDTDSPTLLALGWGVLATWWVGLPLGVLLATASQAGRRHPPLSRRAVARLTGALLVVMAIASAVSGTLGYLFASSDQLVLPGYLAAAIDPPIGTSGSSPPGGRTAPATRSALSVGSWSSSLRGSYDADMGRRPPIQAESRPSITEGRVRRASDSRFWSPYRLELLTVVKTAVFRS